MHWACPVPTMRGMRPTSWFNASGPTPTPTSVPPTQTPTPTITPGGPTLTFTPTPTATPKSASGLITNGGFENGTTGWTLGGTPKPAVSTAQKHSGSYSLLLGSVAAASQVTTSWAYQQVAVPKTGTKLSFSLYMYGVTDDTATYAWQEVDVQSSAGRC